jgi:hypothetical protein
MALEIIVVVITIFILDSLNPVKSNRQQNLNFSYSASSRSIALYRLLAKYNTRYY